MVSIKARMEKRKTLFKKARLIGIGNTKYQNGGVVSDAFAYFAILGCDKYVDVGTYYKGTKYINAFSQLTIPQTIENDGIDIDCRTEAYTVIIQ